MSVTVGMHEAKTRLSELVGMVEAGEDVVLSRSGTPVARLVKIDPAPPKRFGALAGLVPQVSDEEWAEMDEDVRALFQS